MKKRNRFLILSPLILMFVACEQASDTLVSVPNITIDCNSTDNPSCVSPASPTGRVIMTRSGCANLDFEPVASGTVTLTCGVSGCLGTVNSWRDTNGNPVSEILTGRMDLCGLVDFNNNLQEDNGDLVNETSQSIQSEDGLILETWEEV